MLKFSPANSKTKELYKIKDFEKFLTNGRKVYSMDLLSGWSCPFAKECLAKVHEINSKKILKDGLYTKFRCFSASQEATFPGVYNLRKYNFNLLKNKSESEIIKLIIDSMPKDLGICRIHVSGDMFSNNYFRAWMNIASIYQDKIFYAYTKSLPYWIKNKSTVDKIPNFILTASYGGTQDELINEYNLRYSKVVFSIEEAKKLKLEIDHDDSYAANHLMRNQSFALLIHGIMPKGSEASKAIQLLKRKNIKYTYSKN